MYLYDYFAGHGELVNPSDTLQKRIVGDALYLVLAPIGPSGMAIVGDTQQFVGLGKKRVPALVDDGAVRLTVAFANGETSRVIKGYSPLLPAANATEGSIGQMTYDAATRQFQIPVMPGPDGTASILIKNTHPRADPPVRPRPTGAGTAR